MSAGVGAMTMVNQLLSGKGLTANEAAFTERNEATDAPRNFREAEMTIEMMKEIVDNGILRILMEDAMSAVPSFKPITFQGKFNNIYRTNQPAESSYLNTRSLLEFNIVIPHVLHTVPADFELVFPVRFKDANGNYLNLGNWLPVNNFFGRLIDTLQVNRKGDQLKVIPSDPLGSVGRYSTGIMQHMSDEQLAVIERDMLFVKTPVVGEDIHNRVNREANAATYDHFQEGEEVKEEVKMLLGKTY